ncbi:hypothetical protein Ddc_10418 [Ditylenchus destructor]|nr:hypothetical protein Ddc_10418 [Ditylenchus destructor]
MPTDDNPQEPSHGSHFPDFPLYKRLMTSTRKLLQRRLCGCCCVNELAVFKKSAPNEPAVVLTKAETITSQPGGRLRSKSNGVANGALPNGSANNAEVGQRVESNAIASRANDGRNSPNQFDEIDLNADSSGPMTVKNNKLNVDANSSSLTASGSAKTTLSNKQSEKSTKSEKVKEVDEYGKKLAENVTDMMFNEICERAEEVEKDEVLQEETFEIDLNAVTEATDDEISNLGSQPRQPAHVTEQNGYVHRSEDTPPENSTRTQSADISPRTDTDDEQSHSENRMLSSDCDTTKNSHKSMVEAPESNSTPAKLDSPQKPPRTNLYNALINGVPETTPPNSATAFNFDSTSLSKEVSENGPMRNGKETSDQMKDAMVSFKKEHEKLCKKSSTMETKRIDEEEDEEEQRVNGYSQGHASENYSAERLPNGKATIVAKDQTNGASLMYGVESSSEDTEDEGEVSSVVSSPTISTGGRSKQNNNVDRLKSKEDEQFDYKALETDTSERTA